jgi:ArsR family transcriptional regulator
MNAANESIFKALADAQRRRILQVLRQGERPAGDIAQELNLTPATTSHHLALLKNAGLVRVRRDGQQRIYALNASVFEETVMLLTELFKPERKIAP